MIDSQQPQEQVDEPTQLMGLLNHPETEEQDPKKPAAAATDSGFHPIAHPIATLLHTAKAVAKGAGRAVNEMSNTAVEVGAAIDKKTGLYKLVNDEQGEKDFIDWYSKKTEESNPLQIPVGSRETGIYGFVEGAAQFTTAMAGFSKLLGGAGMAEGMAKSVLAGGLSDATAMNPYTDRLSNLVQSGPSFIRNPLTKFLAAKDDDPELLARVKAGLEGVMTGAAVEKFIHYVKATKAGTRNASEDFFKSLNAGDAVEPTVDHGPVKVVHGDDGTVSLQIHDELAQNIVKPQQVEEIAGDAVRKDTQTSDNVTSVPMKDEGQAERVGASINNAVKNAAIPVNQLSEEQQQSILAIRKRISDGADPTDVQNLVDGVDFNFNYTSSPEDAKAIINAISEEMHPEVEKFTNRASEGNGQSHVATLKMADGLLDKNSPEEVIGAIQKAFGDTKDLPQITLATKMYMHGLANETVNLSRAADMDPTNAVAASELSKSLNALFDVHEHLAGTISNTARTLNAQAIDVSEGAAKGGAETVPDVTDRATARLTDGMSDRDIRALARTLSMTNGEYDISDIIKLLKGTKKVAEDGGATVGNNRTALGAAADKLTSFRTEMLLSGPKTGVVNIVNNAVTAFQVPAERWFAGVLSNNKTLRQSGSDQLLGTFMYLHDGLRAANKAWSIADNVLDPSFKTFDTAIQPTPAGDWLNKIVHAPGRFLMASDEFFKNVTYRANVRAQSLRLSREAGITDGGQVAERLADDMKMSFGADGQGVNPKALDMSRYATFTNKLDDGSFGKHLQNMANDNSFVRFVLPFIRTPYNIAMFSMERTPGLGLISKTMRDDIAAGGEQRAVALAKQSAGLFMYSYAHHLANAGMVTGAGPSNYEMRQEWMNAGNQPYSIRVGDKWISYRRLEPFATPLALVADYHTAMGEMKTEDNEQVMTALATAMASSVASKTFLQGISNFFEAVGSRDPNKVHKFLSDGVTSYMPNFMRQTNPDPNYREVQTILDDIKSRTYGLSDKMEPRRNLFGEPIQKPPGYFNRTLNPFVSVKAPDDDIAEQLFTLGKAIAMPDKRIGNVDLSDRESFDNGSKQSPYDRMMELMGKPSDGGPSLRDALTQQMRSEQWKNLSGGTDLYPGGAKYLMASKLISGLQRKAFYNMLKEYPKLQTIINADKTSKAQSLVGGGADSQQQLLNLINQ